MSFLWKATHHPSPSKGNVSRQPVLLKIFLALHTRPWPISYCRPKSRTQNALNHQVFKSSYLRLIKELYSWHQKKIKNLWKATKRPPVPPSISTSLIKKRTTKCCQCDGTFISTLPRPYKTARLETKAPEPAPSCSGWIGDREKSTSKTATDDVPIQNEYTNIYIYTY